MIIINLQHRTVDGGVPEGSGRLVVSKDDHFQHFSKSFVVLLINQKRIPEAVNYFVETTVQG